MNRPVLTFFNNKGGVGKTSLVYHLSWMYSLLGLRILAADLDPQANLTAGFVDEDRLVQVWSDESKVGNTIYDCLSPLVHRTGDIASPILEAIADNLALVLGDLRLSSFESQLSDDWPNTILGRTGAIRVTSALWRTLQAAADKFNADLILVDVGPNLGAINRAILISSDYVVVPLSPDLFSLQGLRNLGPTLNDWRKEWQRVLENREPDVDLNVLPRGTISPIGYVILQHIERVSRVVQAYQSWADKIPLEYRKHVLRDGSANENLAIGDDPNLLGRVRHYRSLAVMAQEARKPIFLLKPADGAAGSHVKIVEEAYHTFETLAQEIAKRISINIPDHN